ncbi:Ser/Thr protein kinase RdoA (MazF antagonist) [Kribbella sp. VKM Ac-2569]|uniref:phosphotransferase family protein n=1 Tax=Kribbella sp. VKM Ac-2569 TaxID=2512220 RepID=UPI00102C9085|nr:phosphotransferase [Kribbella sp. VKM Ac-2569]RZT17200.1 Ser/Thr protein kinase RdoA (MazF antagonist) [Kribbella sp. VKM Ac-2569]
MGTTPRSIIDSVVRSVCGRDVEGLVPLAGGGMNETYRVQLAGDVAVVVRIARQGTPWFIDEAYLMTQARSVGVPTAEVLGLEHLDHEGELLSFSIQQFLPGRSLDELSGELSAAELERLVLDAGEILARVHSVVLDEQRGIQHQLRSPNEREVSRVAGIVREALGPAAAAVVERGADFLRQEVTTRAAPPVSLVHGDFCPKNLLVHDGTVAGIIDWEFAGRTSPAYDFAQWEVDAGDVLQDRLDLVRRGYARVADPESAQAGWTPAFAIDWALEKLGWKSPASPAQFRRCLDVIARYTTP